MEEDKWKRDETPYLVFSCNKCHQYIYIKINQKTKKCLRCGYTHQVNKIITAGEIVKGMTEAVDSVKRKQNELAVKELGHQPDFKTNSEFKIRKSPEKIYLSTKIGGDENSLEEKFKKLLIKIASSYQKFPFYILEIMGNEHDIPNSELLLLIKNFQIKGYLTKCNDGAYTTNFGCSS